MDDPDLATSLEFPLSDEQEKKFLAFKALQTKKIKLLMISIDNKEKEISKLKFMGKDNRRTQMIQALRNKMKDYELLIDVLKEDVMKSKEFSREEINEYVIKKTISGPKRFRPMTREELENKVSDLERQITIYQSKQRQSSISNNVSSSSLPPAPSKSSIVRASLDTKGQAKHEVQSKEEPISSSVNSNNSNNNNNPPINENDTMSAFIDLVQEIQSLKTQLDSKSAVITSQKEELSNLRQRCNELVIHDDNHEQLQQEYNELQQTHEQILNELDITSRKLSQALEDNIQTKIEVSLTLEDSQQETQQLQYELQRILQQNNSLVEQLTKAELELQSYISTRSKSAIGNSTSSTIENNNNSNNNNPTNSSALKLSETKLIKANEKIKGLEEKCINLSNQLKQIDELKDQLRDKNVTIRDLQRSLEDEKAKSMRTATGPSTSGTDTSMDKLASLLDENRKLKQALIVATTTNSGGGGGSNNSTVGPRSTSPMITTATTAVASSSSSSSQLTAKTIGNPMTTNDMKSFLNCLLDTAITSGNGLVSLHNQWDENVLAQILDSSIPLVITLRQVTERILKQEDDENDLTLDKIFPIRKVDGLIRMCDKIEGTSEIHVT